MSILPPSSYCLSEVYTDFVIGPGDQDWFRFYLNGTGSSTNTINLVNSAANQQVQLYNASGANVSPAAKSVSMANLPRGYYYAKVFDRGGAASGAYTLNWNTIARDTYESNDTLSTARNVYAISGRLLATIHSGSDQDWFRFTLKGQGCSASQISLTSGSANQRVQLFDASGASMGLGGKSVSLAGLRAGNYYAKVFDASGAASGNYTLTWNTLAKDVYESNDTLATARNVYATSGKLLGTIHSASDQDWYRFTLKGYGSSLNQISLANNAASQNIQLYRANGEKVGTAGKSISLANLSRGNYYARVYDQNGATSGGYTLTWNVNNYTAASRARSASIIRLADNEQYPVHKLAANQDITVAGSGKDEIIYGAGGGNTSISANGNSVAVYDKTKWGNDTIYLTNKRFAVMLANLGPADVSSLVDNGTLTLWKNSDPGQTVQAQNWDPSKHSVIYGGSLNQFASYINSCQPSLALRKNAWNEVNRAAGGILANG